MASAVETAIRGAVAKGVMHFANFNRNRKPKDRAHPFLSGIHAPVTEELTLTDLQVTGQIPPELSGQYLRIGPNPVKPDPRGHHWFVGDGMVHGLRLSGGKAEWYRNRYIRSNGLERAGGPKAAPGPRRGFGDTVNTNVMRIGGKIMALVEAGSTPVELSETLATVAYSNFGGSLQGPFTAHPHEDPQTGNFHAITYDAMTPQQVWHVVLSPAGTVLRELAIPVAHGPSIHDCAMTDQFVVLFDLPVTFSLKAVTAGARFPYRWNAEHRARVGLLAKDGPADTVIWCDVDPCYAFHVSNSFEDAEGRVVIDLAVYETMFAHGPDGPGGKPLGLERWVVDPVRRGVERTTIDPTGQEFPRPDERFFGRNYRYTWTIGVPETDGEEAFLGAKPLYRHDLKTGDRQVCDFGPGRVPGEFVFVPRSAAAGEGDGWVMGLVINPANATTDLVILDAANIGADPVATVHIPHRVPTGFHGNWLPDLA